ncbi:MAG TPA: hypothetical protein VMF59_14215, partial [Bacteroidota bacterium]|nr:hypothetical protein [Bacteroidota bacterium]
MNIALENHPDGGIWISDDRVNAFVSARSGGVAEVGFHGLQPVSRNSRLLVRPEGVLTVGLRNGDEISFPCTNVDWTPGGIVTAARHGGSRLRVIAQGRSLTFEVTAPSGADAGVRAGFSYRSFFTGVHGERTWSAPVVEEGMLSFSCRDRIYLREWLSRTGPYAGDFLIPEPWRRVIFTRRCRSGLATIDDARREILDADILLYDARTFFRIRGEGFAAVPEDGGCLFTARLSRENNWCATLRLECAEEAGRFDVPSRPEPPGPSPPSVPEIDIPGYPETGRFFANVPGIVRSCTLQETGMTRGTPGGYYWIWAWDNLVTAIEMLRWGDAAGAARIVRFVNAHRDAGDAIPARWTRTLQALDTPPRGTFEFLLLLAASQCAREGAGEQDLNDVYPFAVGRLDQAAQGLQERGLEANIGFYPDLPLAFGRSESSAVAMESGTLYAFCRLLESVALDRRDGATARRAREVASRIEGSFAASFWDEKAGFFLDSRDVVTGKVNEAYPLFSLMFMQSPLGLPLVRRHTGAMALFAEKNFLTEHGTRLLSVSDPRAGAEDALSSWYPHWDIYLVKLLRRGGAKKGILDWLRSVERVLEHLGYAPEFIHLDGLQRGAPDAWIRHGAVSNLNCATGWYRAIVEGVFGIEFDTCGMSVVPLDLGVSRMALSRLMHRGSPWEVIVEGTGGNSAGIRIDGTPLCGCTKVPGSFHDGKPHSLEIDYSARTPYPCFTEIVNAEVIKAEADASGARVAIRG